MKQNTIALVVAVFLATGLYAGDGSIKRSGKPIAGSYIVVLANRDSTPATVASEYGRSHNIKRVHIYDLALNGFSFIGTEAAARAISADRRVLRVEEDAVVVADGNVITQNPPPSWGLDRIDQQALPLDHTYSEEYTGYQTVIYVIDSGVNILPDFQGRIRQRVNFVPDATGNVNPDDVGDCVGHGTGVAALAASYYWGVAKQAQVVSVRVLDCNNAFPNGSASSVIAGVNRMVADHQQHHPYEQAVANMSLGTNGAGIVPALDDAVMNAVLAGITVVVSAGNEFVDACTRSPADLGDPHQYPTPSMASVITVGMTTQSDTMDPESNYGRCVDILAPGRLVGMPPKDGVGVFYGTGTSYAAPLVAGVAAMHMQRYGLANSPGSIEGIIKDAGNRRCDYRVAFQCAQPAFV